jgi:hypothetical protein
MRWMRGAFEPGELGGLRWDLALELIERGGEGVVVENVLIQRYVDGPLADGKVHVSVFSEWDPTNLSASIAFAEVERGLLVVRRLRDADPRLGATFDAHGVEWDYRYDYGMGAVALAELDERGRITWHPEFEPRS